MCKHISGQDIVYTKKRSQWPRFALLNKITTTLKPSLKKAEWIFAVANQQVFSLLVMIESEFVGFSANA